MKHTIKWQKSGTNRWRNKERDGTKRLKGEEIKKTRSLGLNHVRGQRNTSAPEHPPCTTTTTTNFSGQQGRCGVHYPPLSHHFGLVTLNQSGQGNLSTRSLDLRVSQRETNAHFNVKIGPLRKTIGWLSKRTGTSIDDGARKSNNWPDQWRSGKLGTRSRV